MQITLPLKVIILTWARKFLGSVRRKQNKIKKISQSRFKEILKWFD